MHGRGPEDEQTLPGARIVNTNLGRLTTIPPCELPPFCLPPWLSWVAQTMRSSGNWAIESGFKERFGRAASWMRQYIVARPQEDRAAWLVMYMDFQCAVQELASTELNEVIGTLRRIKQMDWPGVLTDKSLECTELVLPRASTQSGLHHHTSL